jgi:hypothetical protein
LTGKASSSGSPLLGVPALLAYLALVKLLIHLITAGNYGYFRDEFYYITGSERLDLGYVVFRPSWPF